jgi:hypothetical protein
VTSHQIVDGIGLRFVLDQLDDFMIHVNGGSLMNESQKLTTRRLIKATVLNRSVRRVLFDMNSLIRGPQSRQNKGRSGIRNQNSLC